MPKPSPAGAAGLLAWYDRHRRVLPWRAAAGERADPYRVWLSEIMLQQTTVATVGPYYQAMVGRWPTVEALAAAELDAVLHAWQGLGYYARARNLHRCAGIVAGELGGRFPNSEVGLRALPGIGAYTAAAVAAIAFDRRATPVDGNIERVVARRFRVTTPLPAAKAELRRLAGTLTPARRAGDHAQALMDLGATVCTPRAPRCPHCPWRARCAAYKAGDAEGLPRRAAKQGRAARHAVAFWVERVDGSVLLRRRPESGLLGGMMELPSTDWTETPPNAAAIAGAAPLKARWRPLPGLVRHVFTHLDLSLALRAGRVAAGTVAPAGCIWARLDALDAHALATLTKKSVGHALQARAGALSRGRRGAAGARDRSA
ncbi:MAG: A/G-specific adenine glycosylase [Alphaproteobacteria bacterium]|nr:A/G-specific adenine glycosylase [Alphaproteobacteria bacterium]